MTIPVLATIPEVVPILQTMHISSVPLAIAGLATAWWVLTRNEKR